MVNYNTSDSGEKRQPPQKIKINLKQSRNWSRTNGFIGNVCMCNAAMLNRCAVDAAADADAERITKSSSSWHCSVMLFRCLLQSPTIRTGIEGISRKKNQWKSIWNSHRERNEKRTVKGTKTSTFDYMVDSTEWELSTIKIIKWFVPFWRLVHQPAAAGGSNLTELKLNVFRCFEVNEEEQQLKQRREREKVDLVEHEINC